MSSRWLLALPVLGAAACLFPDVSLDGDIGSGAASSSSSTDATTSIVSSSSNVGGGATTTTTTTTSSSSTSSSGDGGASSAGGGGSTAGGGGSGGSTGPGGPGTCGDGCDYTFFGAGGANTGGAGSGGAPSTDCDEDDDPNETDCQPCDPAVHHDLEPEDQFFPAAYATVEPGTSFDWDCDGNVEVDYDFAEDGCPTGLGCPAALYYIDPPSCGVETPIENCDVENPLCGALNTGNRTVQCR